jgi:hypothetical protein
MKGGNGVFTPISGPAAEPCGDRLKLPLPILLIFETTNSGFRSAQSLRFQGYSLHLPLFQLRAVIGFSPRLGIVSSLFSRHLLHVANQKPTIF